MIHKWIPIHLVPVPCYKHIFNMSYYSLIDPTLYTQLNWVCIWVYEKLLVLFHWQLGESQRLKCAVLLGFYSMHLRSSRHVLLKWYLCKIMKGVWNINFQCLRVRVHSFVSPVAKNENSCAQLCPQKVFSISVCESSVHILQVNLLWPLQVAVIQMWSNDSRNDSLLWLG